MGQPDLEALLSPDPLTAALQEKIREVLLTLFEEELARVLGAAKGERVATRNGYRHERKARTLTTGLGPVALALPLALRPLLQGAPLSKRAVSRSVGRLKALFDDWQQQPVPMGAGRYLYCDSIVLKVRLAWKVVSVPVLAALGVDAQGRKTVLALELRTSEATAA